MTADAGITKNVSFHTSRHTFAVLTLAAGSDLYTVGKLLGHTSINSTQVYADVVMETKVETISRISNYFLTYKIRGCAVNLNYDTAPYFHHHFILYAALRGLFFPITTFWAYSIRVEGDTAKRTAVDVILCCKLGRRGIHTACESDLSDVQFVFQQVIYNLNHTFHCHGFFGNNQTGIGVSRCLRNFIGVTY